MQDFTVEEQAVELFDDVFGDYGQRSLGWSPGRINLIGEYTDLNNGLVLPMTINLGTASVVRRRDDSKVRAYSTLYGEIDEVELNGVEVGSLKQWLKYVVGVSAVLNDSASLGSGFDILVHSNMPKTGGVSSSAALTTSIALALQNTFGLSHEPLQIARLCQRVEHEFLGVMCGLMDQMVCGMGQRDHAMYIDFDSHEAEQVKAPKLLSVLVVDSGVSRSLHTTEYNKRSVECGMAVDELQGLGCEIQTLRELDASTLEERKPDLTPKLYARARHVVTENDRVISAKRALTESNLAVLGSLMFESHHSLKTDFEVSVSELDVIVETAHTTPGVYGARLTGAGFGGNAIILCNEADQASVESQIKDEFSRAFGRIPETYTVRPDAPAHALAIER